MLAVFVAPWAQPNMALEVVPQVNTFAADAWSRRRRHKAARLTKVTRLLCGPVKLDLSFAGPESLRLAQLLDDGNVTIDPIHTCVELYARTFVDLVPDVARVLAQLAGQYAIDLFIGSTLQMDSVGNSSTVTRGRLAGFGGPPNMGSVPHGRRHSSPAWLEMRPNADAVSRGRKLVVQTTEAFHEGGVPAFVDTLDAVAVDLRADPERTAALRSRGIVATPTDLGVRPTDARRTLLAARSIDDLVTWSGGLYRPTAKLRSW